MAYDHNLPSVLNPTGDYCVPLFIPHHPDYTALLLGVIRTLEELERYERDPNFDNEDAEIVVAQWRDRTITPLIEAIATAQDCGTTMTTTFQRQDIGAIRTTTSLTKVLVTGSNFPFTPTKNNMKIRCYNIAINNSGGSQTEVEIRFNAAVGSLSAACRMFGATGIASTTIAIFTGLTVGVAHDIALYWSVTGGTGSMFHASDLLFEIEEWD